MNKRASIGRQVQEARRAAGLTLREVVARSKGEISLAGLSFIEQGHRHPSLRTLEVLARVLGVVITVTPQGVTVTHEEGQ